MGRHLNSANWGAETFDRCPVPRPTPVARRCPLVVRAGLCMIGVVLLSGCSTLGYYGQAVSGELRVLHKRRAISVVINDPATGLVIRRKLELVLAARRFATSELALPRGRSYTSYVSLKRSYPVWVVYAAPEFSLKPVHWCFLFAGCVPYRGYFRRAAAEAFAKGLRRRGDDVFVTGAVAFSTLGWFADPVYSSMLRWGDARLAGTIFHELAHQKLYVPGDAAFNESFADTVEQIGVERFFTKHAPGALVAWQQEQRADAAAANYVAVARRRLATIYHSRLASGPMRLAKGAVLQWLRNQYRALGVRFGVTFSEGWLSHLNNASLGALATYDRWTASFRRLLACESGKLTAFYAAAAQIGRLPIAARQHRLHMLAAGACPVGLRARSRV